MGYHMKMPHGATHYGLPPDVALPHSGLPHGGLPPGGLPPGVLPPGAAPPPYYGYAMPGPYMSHPPAPMAMPPYMLTGGGMMHPAMLPGMGPPIGLMPPVGSVACSKCRRRALALAVPGLGSCASLGRIWRLWVWRALPVGEPGPPGAQTLCLRCSSEPPRESPISPPSTHHRLRDAGRPRGRSRRPSHPSTRSEISAYLPRAHPSRSTRPHLY